MVASVVLASCSIEPPADLSPAPPAPPIQEEPSTLPAPSTPSTPTDPPPLSEDAINVYVWDVGEALSVLIDDGDTEILIDAGNDRDGKTLVQKTEPYVTDGTIEYVIATHSHADHIGGMEDIYETYHVAHTIYGDTGTTKQFKEFMEAAQAEEDSQLYEDKDEVIELPEGATLTIIDILDGDKNTNNNSIVSVLEYNDSKMLVIGDAEDEKSKTVRNSLTERLRADLLYPIDVFIVGHHGSETSNSEPLLSLITPTYALISSEGPAGQYANPNIDVMTRLATAHTHIYATYKSGDIAVTFKGNEISLSVPESDELTPENYRD
jgi:competence protein ComEC